MKFSELIERTNNYAQDCADAHTSVNGLMFSSAGMQYPTKESNGTAFMGGKLNKNAYIQVVERLDAPRMEWLDNPKRCPVDLRDSILNQLAQLRDNDELFIRHKGDNVRAVLSNRYTPFDNVQFVDLIVQAVETMGVEAQVLRPFIGDELSAYVVVPSVTFDNDPSYKGRDNGGLHPAIYISNSEIGTGAARTTGGLYRSFCSNGAIYGWKAEESLIVRHRYLTASAMLSIVAAGIAEALRMSEKAALAYVKAQDIAVEPVSLKPIVEEWARKYGISVSAKENWLKGITVESAEQEHEQTMLIDVFNAATFSAHTIETVAERELVERMAGDMLYNFTR